MNDGKTLPLQPRDYLVLLALAGGRSHGYGLIKEVERITEGAVHLDPANLHRALQRMVRDGWVDDAGRHTAGGIRRRYYVIAPRGLRLARAEAVRLEVVSNVARARLLEADSEGAS